MREIKNIMNMGEKPSAYTLEEILSNVYEKLSEMRYNYVPVSIFFVDCAEVLELKTRNEVYDYLKELEGGGARYEIIRSKEVDRYNEEEKAFQTVFGIVLEEVSDY